MVSGLWVFGTVPKAQDFWTVLGAWDSQTISRKFKTKTCGIWVFGTVSKACEILGLLQQSQSPGTVPGFWDSAKDPGIPGLSWAFRTVPKAQKHHGFFFQYQRPKNLGQSRDIGLSQRPRVPTPWGLFLQLSNSPRTLGLSQKPGTVPILRCLTLPVGPSKKISNIEITLAPIRTLRSIKMLHTKITLGFIGTEEGFQGYKVYLRGLIKIWKTRLELLLQCTQDEFQI